jgi:acyl-CoA thioester hydrolase
MPEFVETHRGVVYPWLCDQLGHMNVKHYVGMFDEGAFHLLTMCGIGMGAMAETGKTFVDVKHVIEYKAEQRVGSLVKVEGCVTRLGTKSMTLLQRMTNIETNVLAATTEITSVYFNLETRQSEAIPADLRASIGKLLVADGA